jgi:hypothetical protein
MATRTKTVEFIYSVDITSLASNTKRTKTGNTIYIPESSPVFKSVTLVATAYDDATASTSPTNWILGIKLGAVAESTATVTDTITNSGEALTFKFRRDVTSYFTTNWTGTSMAWEASFQMNATPTQNHTFKIIITYEYDDTTTTHIKTIRIPVESTRANMTTSYQTLGGATAIPAITGSYLPEASVTIRQTWVELWGNTADITTATDWISTARINATNTYDWFDNESALLSGRWAYGAIDITAEDLSAARSLEIIVTGITTRLTQMCGMICVTYEFNSSTTSTVYNSIMVGGVDSVSQMGGTAAGDEDVWSRDICLSEPGTLTMKESGVFLFLNDSGAVTINVAVGAQTDTSYAFTVAGTQDGQYSMCHRIDAAGAKGTAGMTLARGPNEYNIQTRSATASAGWGLSGFLLLNYTSSKATAGVGTHAQTRYFHLADTAADAFTRQVTNVTTPTIPDSHYYLIGAVVDIDQMVSGTATQGIALKAERSEVSMGWHPAYATFYRTDAETGFNTSFGAARDLWKRHPGDPDPERVDIETSRAWRLDCVPGVWASWGMWVTWCSHAYTISGTVSGYADADGAGLTVKVYRVSDDEHRLTLTTTSGGAFSGTWHDDVQELYCVVYEDGTHVGRSANATAT